MTKLSRGKIAYNLDETPYIESVFYPEINETVIYRFSSEFYRTKFKDSLQDHRDKINNSLRKRFNIHVTLNLLSDIKNYEKIEKRGFLIEREGQKYRCLKIVQLNGIRISKND